MHAVMQSLQHPTGLLLSCCLAYTACKASDVQYPQHADSTGCQKPQHIYAVHGIKEDMGAGMLTTIQGVLWEVQLDQSRQPPDSVRQLAWVNPADASMYSFIQPSCCSTNTLPLSQHGITT